MTVLSTVFLRIKSNPVYPNILLCVLHFFSCVKKLPYFYFTVIICRRSKSFIFNQGKNETFIYKEDTLLAVQSKKFISNTTTQIDCISYTKLFFQQRLYLQMSNSVTIYILFKEWKIILNKKFIKV